LKGRTRKDLSVGLTGEMGGPGALGHLGSSHGAPDHSVLWGADRCGVALGSHGQRRWAVDRVVEAAAAYAAAAAERVARLLWLAGGPSARSSSSAVSGTPRPQGRSPGYCERSPASCSRLVGS